MISRAVNRTGNEIRICMRAAPGFVAMHWHDGVKLAALRSPFGVSL